MQAECDAFNAKCPVGGKVRVKLDGVDEPLETTTKSVAQILSGHSSVVWMHNVSGCYLLDRVTPMESEMNNEQFASAAPDTLEHLPSHHCAPAPDDRRILQAEGKHPAPCARFCESNAYEIEIRRMKRQVADYSEINRQRKEAVEHAAILESEAEQLRMSVHNARIEIADADDAMRVQTERMIAAQAGQEPLRESFSLSLASIDAHDPQRFIDGAKWQANRSTPPAPANSIAIVQAALEAAAKVCEGHAAGLDNDWNKTLGVANDLAEVGIDCAIDIRAIAPQSILDGIGK